MNKVILCGRLTKDVELRYSSKDSSKAIARYTIAVDSGYGDYKRTDFFNCVAYGKSGEFADKYFKKGLRVLVEGRIQNDEYEKDGKKSYFTNIIIESQEFADGNKGENKGEEKPQNITDGFQDIKGATDDEGLPFE